MSSGMDSRNRRDDIYYQLRFHMLGQYMTHADYRLMTLLWTRVDYVLAIGFDWMASMAEEDIHDYSLHMVCIRLRLIVYPVNFM